MWKSRGWLRSSFACNPHSASCVLAKRDHPVHVLVERVRVNLKFAHPVELDARVFPALLRGCCAWSLRSQLVQ
eukprot:4145048-Amphidinium_carterae.1